MLDLKGSLFSRIVKVTSASRNPQVLVLQGHTKVLRAGDWNLSNTPQLWSLSSELLAVSSPEVDKSSQAVIMPQQLLITLPTKASTWVKLQHPKKATERVPLWEDVTKMFEGKGENGLMEGEEGDLICVGKDGYTLHWSREKEGEKVLCGFISCGFWEGDSCEGKSWVPAWTPCDTCFQLLSSPIFRYYMRQEDRTQGVLHQWCLSVGMWFTDRGLRFLPSLSPLRVFLHRFQSFSPQPNIYHKYHCFHLLRGRNDMPDYSHVILNCGSDAQKSHLL